MTVLLYSSHYEREIGCAISRKSKREQALLFSQVGLPIDDSLRETQ